MQTQEQAEAWGPQAGEQAGCMFLMMVMGLRVLDRTVLCGRVHCAIIKVGCNKSGRFVVGIEKRVGGSEV